VKQHLHDVLASALKVAQRKARAAHGPLWNRVAQADYVAQQPTATQSQKAAAAQLSHQVETQIGPADRHLIAFKLLIDAIQDDVDAQKQRNDPSGNIKA